jgi:hypothetical protein
MVGIVTGEPGWSRVRPPMVALDAAAVSDVSAKISAMQH